MVSIVKKLGAGLGVLALLASLSASAQTSDATYEYDALGRLNKVTYSDGTYQRYFYDAAGNRVLARTDGGEAPEPFSGAVIVVPLLGLAVIPVPD
jgi:YD repeat-containing protein